MRRRAERPVAVRAIRAVVAPFVVLLFLTGCVGLPRSSGVQQAVTAEVPQLVVKAKAPTSGETPQQIVAGFLRAATATDVQYTVARQYLTGNAVASWNPLANVVIHGGGAPRLSSTSKAKSIQVSAPLIGTVDAEGRYTQATSGARARTTIGMVRVRGQWRIGVLPTSFGLWLDEDDFHARFHSRSIYYVSPVAPELVPDVRWFRDGPGLATALARAQLEAVPAYLRGGAITGFPAGTALDVQSVAVTGGQADVNLTTTALQANSTQRIDMTAQMLSTLAQAPGVQRVSLRVDDSVLPLVGVGPTATSAAQLGFTGASPAPAAALLLYHQRVKRVLAGYPDRPASKSLTPSLITPSIPDGWIDLAVPASGGEIAAVGGDHKDFGRWLSSGFYQLKRFGTGLTRPSFDGQDGLWVAGVSLKSGASSVWVIDTSKPAADATPRSLAVPWLGKSRIVALRLAADDQRVVVIVRDPRTGRDRLGIAGVIRDTRSVSSGRPLTLATPMWIAQSLTHLDDVGWSSATSLVALGGTSDHATLLPYLIDLDGESVALRAVRGATSITAVPNTSVVYVMSGVDTLSARAGQAWFAPARADQIVVPGE